MDLDLAFRVDEPPIPTDSSTPTEKASYELWERSNRLSLMLIKKHISKGIRGSIPECTKVKDFLKAIEDQYVRSDKALASTLMKRLSDVKYNGSRSVREHIMHMRDIAAQLKPLEVDISKPFLVHLILNSLPKEYGPFKITYNAQKEKWSVNELLTMCVQEEERLKNENIEVANLVTQNKGKLDTKRKIARSIRNGLRRKGFLSLRKPMGSEQSIYSCNQMRSQVEVVGTFRLFFKNGYVLDLERLKIVDSIFRPIQIFCDNSAAVFFSKNNKSGSSNKHIDIKYLVVREKVNKKEIVIQYIRTELMVADPMTKALPANSYRNHVDRMGLVNPM
ncbi:hypothetical protein Sango_1168800 [Sesamum angolense]|uniref:Polyprotein n=1 Tax=Sesamum angolense TaxID=2727404 RepID=A0AAE1WW09_9LAMI|nr:hypothetical protein Sango_1168800 [Sesamum angolense]